MGNLSKTLKDDTMKETKISIKTDSKLKALDKYAGKWAAFWDGKVVAHRKTLRRLMKKVRKIEKKQEALGIYRWKMEEKYSKPHLPICIPIGMKAIVEPGFVLLGNKVQEMRVFWGCVLSCLQNR